MAAHRILAALLLTLALTGCVPALAATAPAAQTGSAAAALAHLPVKGRAPKTGYARDQFPHWSDLDHDGCDTRAETLDRNGLPGTETRDRDGCVVGAHIHDPYNGRTAVEPPGRPSGVDIDHVVALSNAWQTGAQQLTRARREALANDPLNLVAVDRAVNRAKGDGDAATWLPPDRAARCGYVARQIAVKTRYRLWVTAPEQAAMHRVLGTCPGQKLPQEAR